MPAVSVFIRGINLHVADPIKAIAIFATYDFGWMNVMFLHLLFKIVNSEGTGSNS